MPTHLSILVLFSVVRPATTPENGHNFTVYQLWNAARSPFFSTQLFSLLLTLRMHTSDGHHDYGAGQAFYWSPGHAPEALEDCEYIDFSPSAELARVVEHIRSQ